MQDAYRRECAHDGDLSAGHANTFVAPREREFMANVGAAVGFPGDEREPRDSGLGKSGALGGMPNLIGSG